MAKERRPKSKPPKVTGGATVSKAIQEFLNMPPPGRAVVEGSDPRNEGVPPEVTGWTPDDQPILKPGKQIGRPEINLSPADIPGDTGLIHGSHGATPDTSGDLGETAPFSAEQIRQLLDDIFGGGIQNDRPLRGLDHPNRALTQGVPRSTPRMLGQTPLPPAPRMPLGQTMPRFDQLPLTQNPVPLNLGGTLLGQGMEPSVRKRLLTQLARNQAVASGQHLIR